MSPEKPTRRYEKRRRAEQEEQTRLRITEAAVTLHGSVGPARTTVSAVAQEAGVQRATVYRHFPDEEALFGACSAHWATQHPPPDPGPWAAIDDPEDRLRTGLAELYAFYRGGEAMLANVLRDAGQVAALGALDAGRRAYLRAIEDLLAAGFAAADERLLRAMLALALEFATWRSLTRDSGLADGEAIDAMARAVTGAADPQLLELSRSRSPAGPSVHPGTGTG